MIFQGVRQEQGHHRQHLRVPPPAETDLACNQINPAVMAEAAVTATVVDATVVDATITASTADDAPIIATIVPQSSAAPVPFDSLDVDVIDVSGDGGVLKKIITAAAADAKGPPEALAPVSAHYTGTLAATGVMFDSSRHRGQPITVQIGTGKIFKGWELGLGSMKTGERAVLRIRPDYAYGPNACVRPPVAFPLSNQFARPIVCYSALPSGVGLTPDRHRVSPCSRECTGLLFRGPGGANE